MGLEYGVRRGTCGTLFSRFICEASVLVHIGLNSVGLRYGKSLMTVIRGQYLFIAFHFSLFAHSAVLFISTCLVHFPPLSSATTPFVDREMAQNRHNLPSSRPLSTSAELPMAPCAHEEGSRSIRAASQLVRGFSHLAWRHCCEQLSCRGWPNSLPWSFRGLQGRRALVPLSRRCRQ